jgi:LL-diaminopimelate aminotransferase
MNITRAKRMEELAPYLFADLDRKKKEALDRGVDVISLTIGDPDLPTPQEIVTAGQQALTLPVNHRYPDYAGSAAFRSEAARWMKRRFDVDVDADREVAALIGSKEGIAHLPFVYVDPGDVVLCPEPGYPVYDIATRLAGGEVYHLPLVADNAFLPDLDAIPGDVARRAKILWINYPNNPTGAVAPLEFYQQAVAFAQRHNCLLGVDAAYSEIGFDAYRAPSIFEVQGAREVAIEFHSLSKSFNMTGWRVGFAVGAQNLVGPLADLKSNLDSGIFTAVQDAGIAALQLWPNNLPDLLETYRRRRDCLVSSLQKAGYQASSPQATFYVWMPVPGGDDVRFAAEMIEKVGVLVTPGSGFGPSGKGYVRFSLTVDEDRLEEAVARIEKVGPAGS